MKHFFIVKMMFHALYFLVVLVAFSGNQHNISLLSHHASSANSFLTVNN